MLSASCWGGRMRSKESVSKPSWKMLCAHATRKLWWRRGPMLFLDTQRNLRIPDHGREAVQCFQPSSKLLCLLCWPQLYFVVTNLGDWRFHTTCSWETALISWVWMCVLKKKRKEKTPNNYSVRETLTSVNNGRNERFFVFCMFQIWLLIDYHF